ncbi:MAG: helix-turn-helix transcriptional regulator [Leptospiraceae bacterium]|nr:helix-turn-helix transcriptional regulator [Leptospiraceae bacterium]MCP5510720.1 helix-turn-helix transcriptional regulator [Leptospiraceae bacterium]
MKKLKFELSKKQLDQAIKGIQGIAHPVRFMILYSLLKEEQSVSVLSEFTNVSQSVTSQHLSKMKDSGILDSRKESNKVFYFIKDERYKEIIRILVKFYSEPEKVSKKRS